MADVDMQAKAAADAETERRKALLVYRGNVQEASDDDASDEDDEPAAPAPPADDDDEGGVRVEKDDDESLDAPSDDDLDSTATPRRSETDEDDGMSSKAPSPLPPAAPRSEADSASELPSSRAPSPSPSSTSQQHVDESTTLTLKSGTTSNVGAIIAARRRTVARKECEVCHEPRNGRRALLCVQCKSMFHTSCFRQQFPKFPHASSNRQWLCPECEPAAKAVDAEKQPSNTPRKAVKGRGSRGTKTAAGNTRGNHEDATGSSAASSVELQRMKDVVIHGGKKINTTILEQTGEMLHITQTLTKEIDSVMGPIWRAQEKASAPPTANHGDIYVGNSGSSIGNNVKQEQQQQQQQQPVSSPPPPPFLLVPASSSSHASAVSSQIVATNDGTQSNGNAATQNNPSTTPATEQEVLLRRVHAGLGSLKQLLEQLQVAGIQFEVDLVREVKTIPSHEDRRSSSNGGGSTRKSQASGSGAGRSSTGSKGKSGASRLYSSKQIQKLEEWYQRSSRPESSEIQAMYRIINCPEYADPELQPDGIAVKQIRIWFDNRRAKERLDYMRLKMKDISTTDMDADSVKKMKAAYIDEAKEVLEARVSRMRENGQMSGHIVDAADLLLLQTAGDGPLPKAPKSSPSGAFPALIKDNGETLKPSSAAFTNPKKRIRIDYVASVRKAVKDARDAGKSEEEIKALRSAAIERARERLHVPYKNARTGPSKPLGKEEVSHIKLKMLKLLEEDAPAEELTDIIELLLSLIIPRAVLIESDFQRQLELILIAHKDNKELVRQTKKLQEEFKMIVENGDSAGVMAAMAGEPITGKKRKDKSRSLLLSVDTESLPGTPGSSPSSGPTPSPESRRPRVKFSLQQLIKLEKYFHKEDTPSKKRLDKIAARLNGIAALDPNSDEAQRSIDYKQIRCWFYKRRSANQPPQALSAADLHGEDALSTSSSDTESDDEKSGKSRAKPKPKALLTPSASTATKRKLPPSEDNSSTKRTKTEGAPAVQSSPVKAERVTNSDDGAESTGSIHAGRVFNVKQLATIIEEYEKNPRPSGARLEELAKVLNQGDHIDAHSGTAVGITKQQVKRWFSNRRAKERLDLIKMKIKETQGVPAAESGGSDTEDDERDATGKQQSIDASPAGRETNSTADAGSPAKPNLVIRNHDPDDEEMKEVHE